MYHDINIRYTSQLRLYGLHPCKRSSELYHRKMLPFVGNTETKKEKITNVIDEGS